MASQVTMPQMGFDMHEGRLIRWLKRPGDPVQKGDALAEIETDKATVELEAFEGGRLVKLLVDEGAMVPVGEPVALLEAAAGVHGEAYGAPAEPAPVQEAAAPPAPEAGPRPSPAARQDPTWSGNGSRPNGAGREAGADGFRFDPPYHDPADYLDGPGPDPVQDTPGRTLGEHPFAQTPSTLSRTGTEAEAPVQAPPEGPARPAQPAAAAPDTPENREEGPPGLEPWTRMRQAIARRMSQSKQQIPHFYETVRVEMDQALAFRADVNQDLPQDDRITVNDLLVRAAALALEEFPNLNGTYTEEGLRLNPTVDVAVAVAVESGLLTPVVRACNDRGLVELAREVHRVVRSARKGRLKPDEYSGGTFTVSNLGMFDVESFSAIINPPQTAILAAGGTREEVVVTSGQMRPATIMRLTVAADHRVTDGVEVARFLNRIREVLEHPWLLVSPHLRG